MPAINVNGAAARLLATGALAKAGLCLHYCWLAISQGKVHYITGGADTAYNTWLAVPADHQHSSRNVPKDFPAFLGKKFLSAAGDVIISNGDGTFVATDWPKSRQVGVCTLEQREKQTGRKFVGWASSMGGYQLESTMTAGESGTPIIEPIGPEDMKVILNTSYDAAGNKTGVLNYLVGEVTLKPLHLDRDVETAVKLYGPAIAVDSPKWDMLVSVVTENVAALRGNAPAAAIDYAALAKAVNDDAAKRLSA